MVRHFATIGEVYEDGVSLIFDGEDAATEKHYLCNTSAFFVAGDRVKILPDSGTYIVEYVVGTPQKNEGGSVIGIPSGGSAGQVLKKNSGNDGDVVWGDVNRVKSLINQYNSTSQSLESMDIQFRTGGLTGTAASTIYIRVGSGTWRALNLS